MPYLVGLPLIKSDFGYRPLSANNGIIWQNEWGFHWNNNTPTGYENITLIIVKIGTVQKRSKNGDRTFTNYATNCRPVITEQSRQSGLEVITR